MKLQVLIKGRDKSGRLQFYRTITEPEFPELFRLITRMDGKRPWDQTTKGET